MSGGEEVAEKSGGFGLQDAIALLGAPPGVETPKYDPAELEEKWLCTWYECEERDECANRGEHKATLWKVHKVTGEFVSETVPIASMYPDFPPPKIDHIIIKGDATVLCRDLRHFKILPPRARDTTSSPPVPDDDTKFDNIYDHQADVIRWPLPSKYRLPELPPERTSSPVPGAEAELDESESKSKSNSKLEKSE